MAQTLYRQYRPNTFAALFGQDTARTILQNALARERLAHAYLFSGPRGTGKTTTARILARAATCEKPTVKDPAAGAAKAASKNAVFEPCNKCEACLAQLNDHAPDVVEIDAASNRGIEDIRSLREQAHYLPMTLKRKVYIIDEVHMLTTDAFNALLKTLEEPPAHCLFILATTELHKVPATIRSRCQLIRFERGTVDAITAKLDSIVTDKGWEIEEGVTSLIAAHAAGGFRDAETQLEQLTTRFGTVSKAQSIDALGITDIKLLEALLAAILNGELAQTRDALAQIEVNDQHRCEQLITALIEHVRRRLSAEAKPTNESILTLTDALTKMLEGFILIKGSPHPKLVLESTCYEIAATGQRGIKAGPAPEPLEDAPGAATKVATANMPATPERIVVPTAPPIEIKPHSVKDSKAPVVELREVAIKDIRQAWKEMIKVVSRESAPLGQMLRETVIHTAENFKLTVHVKYKFHVEKLMEKKNRSQVELLLEQISHEKWGVDYELKDTLPRRQPSKELSGETAAAAAAVFGS